MNFQQLDNLILDWAVDRQIIPNASSSTQMLKVVSEIGELADELIKGDREAMKLELGDVMVTLSIFAAMERLDLVQCMGMAYDKIKDRKGTMLPNGVFVKE